MTEPNRDARGTSRTTVVADDGVSLAVTVDGPSDAHLTAVCLHGHCQDAGSWVATCDLVDLPGVRIVRYDQRGHGSSGIGDAMSFNLDRLSSDLDVVLRAVAPSGPVVLVGYSMGGMVALAHARRYPESIGDRIVGSRCSPPQRRDSPTAASGGTFAIRPRRCCTGRCCVHPERWRSRSEQGAGSAP